MRKNISMTQTEEPVKRKRGRPKKDPNAPKHSYNRRRKPLGPQELRNKLSTARKKVAKLGQLQSAVKKKQVLKKMEDNPVDFVTDVQGDYVPD